MKPDTQRSIGLLRICCGAHVGGSSMLVAVLLNGIDRCSGGSLFQPLVISNGFLGLLNSLDKSAGLRGKVIPWPIIVMANLRSLLSSNLVLY